MVWYLSPDGYELSDIFDPQLNLINKEYLGKLKPGMIYDCGKNEFIGQSPIKSELRGLLDPSSNKGWGIRYSWLDRIKHFFWGLFS